MSGPELPLQSGSLAQQRSDHADAAKRIEDAPGWGDGDWSAYLRPADVGDVYIASSSWQADFDVYVANSSRERRLECLPRRQL